MLQRQLRPIAQLLTASSSMFTMSTASTTNSTPPASFPATAYIPRHATWPYNPSDFLRSDPSPDTQFYAPARLVTHIDDNAISLLRRYYSEQLPKQGRILDLCSSWISHFPTELEDAARASAHSSVRASSINKGEVSGSSHPFEDISSSTTNLEVIGMGMNTAELDSNPILSQRIVQDLNADPALPAILAPLNAMTCVVSIDYLTQPLQVLQSAHSMLVPGSYVHLIISNRCFPTKVIRRWMRISEKERLDMVGDYLHFAGFEEIEVVTLSEGRRSDPLWVVRGKRGGE